MRFYAILKYLVGAKEDSVSVGKMLPLRIATLFGGIRNLPTVQVNVKQSSDFQG